MIMMVLLCMMQDLKNSVLNTRGGACSERRRKYIPVGLSAASMPQALSTQTSPRLELIFNESGSALVTLSGLNSYSLPLPSMNTNITW